MELILIIIVSFLISFTWLYYFKLIDLFEREKIIHIVATFILGTAIPFIIYPIHDYIFLPLNISDSNNPLFSFLYYTFAVGLLEEFIKAIPVLIIIYAFKKAINEPLDYVKYICVSALGFAFGENIEYATAYGEYVLLGRSILSVPGHMFFSTLFIYGFIEYKYHNIKAVSIPKYFLIAALAHGIYDFLLTFEIAFLGVILNILFFFLIISAFVTILNNNLNHSPFYTPKKVIDQEKVRKHLIIFYVPILLIVIFSTGFFKNTETALSVYISLMFWKASVLYVLIVRLSRFSIIPQVKNKVRLEFPFYYKSETTRDDFNLFFGILTVKGESHNYAKIATLYEESIKVIPLTLKNSFLKNTYEGIIEQKISLNNEPFFIMRLYFDESKTNSKHYLLRSKTTGISHTSENNPIVSLNSIDLQNKNKLIFHEWVILKKK